MRVVLVPISPVDLGVGGSIEPVPISTEEPFGSAFFYRVAEMRVMKRSEIDRIIEREDERLAGSTAIAVRITRRSLLKRVALLAAAWTIGPWQIGVPSALGQELNTLDVTATIEAFADTLIPGQKRFPGDRAIAGVVSGAGAVQAGAIEMLNFVGFEEVLPLLAVGLDALAVLYAAGHSIALDPTVPPFVALDFNSRTALLVEVLDESALTRSTFYGIAALCFVAYNTAGYLPTAVAISEGHPGLAAIGFPAPNSDGIWRFPEFSYERILARPHPHSKSGNPA